MPKYEGDFCVQSAEEYERPKVEEDALKNLETLVALWSSSWRRALIDFSVKFRKAELSRVAENGIRRGQKSCQDPD